MLGEGVRAVLRQTPLGLDLGQSGGCLIDDRRRSVADVGWR